MFVTTIAFIILLLFWQNDACLRTALRQSQPVNRTFQALQAGLGEQIAGRTRDLQQALDELEARTVKQARMCAALEQQREVILGLSVPVLPITDHSLVILLLVHLISDDCKMRSSGRLRQSNNLAPRR